jgi:hypothetical protein
MKEIGLFDLEIWDKKAALQVITKIPTFFLHNFESFNFLRRCENIERKTPSKNILEFHIHTLFLYIKS